MSMTALQQLALMAEQGVEAISSNVHKEQAVYEGMPPGETRIMKPLGHEKQQKELNKIREECQLAKKNGNHTPSEAEELQQKIDGIDEMLASLFTVLGVQLHAKLGPQKGNLNDLTSSFADAQQEPDILDSLNPNFNNTTKFS